MQGISGSSRFEPQNGKPLELLENSNPVSKWKRMLPSYSLRNKQLSKNERGWKDHVYLHRRDHTKDETAGGV